MTRACEQCGKPSPMHPLYDPVKSPRFVCLRCALTNLASWSEEIEPEDSLQDISKGEQTGMFFRELARQV